MIFGLSFMSIYVEHHLYWGRMVMVMLIDFDSRLRHARDTCELV